jgi:hypothetical protein
MTLQSKIDAIQFSRNPCPNDALAALAATDLPDIDRDRMADQISHQVALQRRRLDQLRYLMGR